MHSEGTWGTKIACSGHGREGKMAGSALEKKTDEVKKDGVL